MAVGGEAGAAYPDNEEELVGEYIFFNQNHGTEYYNLKWLKRKSDGTVEWKDWKNPMGRKNDSPYWTVYRGHQPSLGGVMVTCGKAPAGWCPLPLPTPNP